MQYLENFFNNKPEDKNHSTQSPARDDPAHQPKKSTEQKIQAIQEEIDQGKGNVMDAIEKVMDRGDKIDGLAHKSDQLVEHTRIFNRKSKRLAGVAARRRRLALLGTFDFLLTGVGIGLLSHGGEVYIVLGWCAISVAVATGISGALIAKYGDKIDEQLQSWKHRKKNQKPQQIKQEVHVAPVIQPKPIATQVAIPPMEHHRIRLNKQDIALINTFQQTFSRVVDSKDSPAYELLQSTPGYHHQSYIDSATPLIDQFQHKKHERITLTDQDREIMHQFMGYARRRAVLDNFVARHHTSTVSQVDEFTDSVHQLLEGLYTIIQLNYGEAYLNQVMDQIDIDKFLAPFFKKALIDSIKQVNNPQSSETELTPDLMLRWYHRQWRSMMDHISFSIRRINRENNIQSTGTSPILFLLGTPTQDMMGQVSKMMEHFIGTNIAAYQKAITSQQKTIQQQWRGLSSSTSPKSAIKLSETITAYAQTIRGMRLVGEFSNWLAHKQKVLQQMQDFLSIADKQDPSVQAMAVCIKQALMDSIPERLSKIVKFFEQLDLPVSARSAQPHEEKNAYDNDTVVRSIEEEETELDALMRKNYPHLVAKENTENKFYLFAKRVLSMLSHPWGIRRHEPDLHQSDACLIDPNNPVILIQSELDQCLKWLNDLDASLPKKAQELSDDEPLTIIARYLNGWAASEMALNDLFKQVSSIPSGKLKAFRQSLIDLCKSKKTDLQKLIALPYEGAASVKRIQAFKKIVDTLATTINAKLKEQLDAYDTSLNEHTINEWESLKSTLLANTLLKPKVTEAIRKLIDEKEEALINFKQSLDTARAKNNMSGSISVLNQAEEKGIFTIHQSFNQLKKEIEFLQWMQVFESYSLKFDTLKPIDGKYKLILSPIRTEKSYPAIQKVIVETMNQLKRNDFSKIKSSIDPFISRAKTIESQKEKKLTQVKETLTSDAESAIKAYFDATITSVIHQAVEDFQEGKFDSCMTTFKTIENKADIVFDEVNNYISTMNALTQSIAATRENIQLIDKKILTLDQTEWIKTLDSIEKRRTALLTGDFKGCVTTDAVKKLQTEVNQLDTGMTERIKQKLIIHQERVNRYQVVCKQTDNMVKSLKKSTGLQETVKKEIQQMLEDLSKRLSTFEKDLQQSQTKQTIQAQIDILNRVECKNSGVLQTTQMVDCFSAQIKFLDWMQAFMPYSEALDQIQETTGQYKTVSNRIQTIHTYDDLQELYEENKVLSLPDLSFMKNYLPTLKEFSSRFFFLKDILLNEPAVFQTLDMGKLSHVKVAIGKFAEKFETAIALFQEGKANEFYDAMQSIISDVEKDYFTEKFSILYRAYKLDLEARIPLKQQIADMIQDLNDKPIITPEDDTLRELLINPLMWMSSRLDGKWFIETYDDWIIDRKNNANLPKERLKDTFTLFEKRREVSFAHFVARYHTSARFQYFWKASLKNGSANQFMKTQTEDGWHLAHVIAKYQSPAAFQLVWESLVTGKGYLANRKIFAISAEDAEYRDFSIYLPLMERENKEMIGHTLAHMIAQYQSAEAFECFWSTLNDIEKESIAQRWVTRLEQAKPFNVLKTITQPSISEIILHHQPADTFLSWWASLSDERQKALLMDKQFFSSHAGWGVFSSAIIHLPSKKFHAWLQQLDKLKLSPKEWETLLMHTHDRANFNAIDLATCYNPDMLSDLFNRCTDHQSLEQYRSTVVKSIVREDKTWMIEYHSAYTKDASGNTLIEWLAHQNDLTRLEQLFSNKSKVKDFIRYCKGHGNPLQTAVLAGNLGAVLLIAHENPALVTTPIEVSLYRTETPLTLSFDYINKHGFSTMKPIIDHLLMRTAAQSSETRAWFYPRHQDRLTRMGYGIDFTEPSHPRIKPLSALNKTNIIESTEDLEKGLELSKSAHILMPVKSSGDIIDEDIPSKTVQHTY